MRVADVMTRDVQTVSPADTIQTAAAAMDNFNVGALRVCDGERLQGVITDRDITVRATAAGQSPTVTKVADVMTDQIDYVFEDEDVEEAANKMKARQIRRLPVIDRDKKLLGIISLGDLATKDDGGQAAAALEQVSKPSRPDRGRTKKARTGSGGGEMPPAPSPGTRA
jgi:CBS domain-containing protein